MATNYTRLERHMIEACLDDELDVMYGNFTVNQVKRITVDASDIIKKCTPELYEQYFKEYCERNSILIKKESNQIIYLEVNPD